jgi:uncharacterized protein with NRDE domain
MDLSNGILNENWPKLKRAKERIHSILSNKTTTSQESNPYFQILQDATLSRGQRTTQYRAAFRERKISIKYFYSIARIWHSLFNLCKFSALRVKVVREERVWI